MIKGIIFDLNGPILATEETTKIIVRRHAEKYGYEYERLREIVGEYFRGVYQEGYRDLENFFEKTKPSLGITIEEMNAILEDIHSPERIDARMVACIEELKKKYKIALLTSFGWNLQWFLKDVFGIYHLFDVVESSEDMGVKKPDPAAFQYVLDRLGLPADETVFIDDNPVNVAAAETLGIHGIVYRDFEQCRRELDALLSESSF